MHEEVSGIFICIVLGTKQTLISHKFHLKCVHHFVELFAIHLTLYEQFIFTQFNWVFKDSAWFCSSLIKFTGYKSAMNFSVQVVTLVSLWFSLNPLKPAVS